MKEIMEEYGEFLVEAIAALLLILAVTFLFFGGEISRLIQSYIMGVLGV